jgi:hypothetical protein
VATAQFRFYAELNQFLAPCYRQRSFSHGLSRDASVKHMIEALGVPHTEVELILVNGESVDFSCRLQALSYAGYRASGQIADAVIE